MGTGSSDFGGVKVSTASTTVAAGVGTGTKTNFVSIATTYTSARVLFEFKTSSGDYEFNELTLVHDGTNVDLQEGSNVKSRKSRMLLSEWILYLPGTF